MDGGDVEALDAQGRRGKRKRAFELQQRVVGALVGIARAHHKAHESMVGVGLRQIEQLLFLAALGHMDGHLAGAPFRQPRLQQLGVVGQLAGDAHLVGHVGTGGVIALEEACDKLLLPHVEPLVEHKLAATARATLTDGEHLHASDGLLAIEADDVHVNGRGEHDLLALPHVLEGGEPVAAAGGLLEVELGGRLAHLIGQLLLELGVVAGQEPLHGGDVLLVVGLGAGARAHARTQPHA